MVLASRRELSRLRAASTCQESRVAGGNVTTLLADGMAALAHAWRSAALTLQSLGTGRSLRNQMETEKDVKTRKESTERAKVGMTGERGGKPRGLTVTADVTQQARQSQLLMRSRGVCCLRIWWITQSPAFETGTGQVHEHAPHHHHCTV
jgi:hypothetical protein